MVHENAKILTFSEACVFQSVCMLHTITKMCYPCNIQIFLALKIEEKNISDCQILETKSSNIVYLFTLYTSLHKSGI